MTVVDYNPLTITSLTVSSDNFANSSYAKAGDEINITLVTDGSDVGNVTGNILGADDFAQSSSNGHNNLFNIYQFKVRQTAYLRSNNIFVS